MLLKNIAAQFHNNRLMAMNSFSIENQLNRRTIFAVSIVLLLISILIGFIITNLLNDHFDKNLLSKAQILQTLTIQHIDGVEFHFADEFMPQFKSKTNPEYFQFWIEGGGIWRQGGLGERSRSLVRTQKNLIMLKNNNIQPVFTDVLLPDGREGRMVQITFLPQFSENHQQKLANIVPRKQVILAVATEKRSLNQLLKTIHISLLLGIFGVIVLFVFIIRYTVSKGLMPLKKIHQQITLFNAESLNERLSIENPPTELAEIIDQFNFMLSRLEESFGREKQFSADVAHELRTPIAELKMLTELALRWPDNKKITKDFYVEVLQVSNRMQNMVNNLMVLARHDCQQISVVPQTVNLHEYIRIALNRFQYAAQLKQLKFHFETNEDICIKVSLTEFELILNNLISNAIDYSPENSIIVICTQIVANKAVFIISNTTENLEQVDLPLLADRFWRKDPSRSSHEHAGLGLSLVKAMVHLLALEIEFSLSEEKQFSVKIFNIQLVI